MAQDFAYRNYSHTQGKVKNGGGGRMPRDPAGPDQSYSTDPAAVEVAAVITEPGAGEGAILRALASATLRLQQDCARGLSGAAWSPAVGVNWPWSARTIGGCDRANG
ncbi:hypothetical protein AB0H76_19950 [Nocardia sp. NPDC050712]|uniref:hypothetical protein n=1 Tax=Nocardia sp. NPDC050712 TaxID=3155518 RepID=UPI0033F2AF01